jgi:hypothetical protein
LAGERSGRAAFIGLALFGCAGVAAGIALSVSRASTLDRAQQRASEVEASLAARVDGLRQELRKRAEEGSAIPELRAAVENQVDVATFLDQFEKEDWWASYLGFASGVVRDGKVAIVRGMTAAQALEAARDPTAVQVVGAEEGTGPILAAAHRQPLRSGATFALVLGRRLDGGTLGTLLAAPVAAVGLTDGQRVRASAGDAASAPLSALAGRVGERRLVGPSGAWAAAAVPLDDGLSLVGVTGPLPPAPAAALFWALIAAGALVAMVGLALAVRARPVSAPATAAEPRPASVVEAAAALPASTPAMRAAALLPGSMPGMRGLPASPVGVSPVTPGFAQSPPRATGLALATALAAEATPAFGRYTLLERIGEGGMAEVFRARLSGAESFTKLCAIKRLKPHLALNPEAVNQFIDEARLGSVLAHSNIASVSDFGRVGDGYFLAEEYIEGRTLAEIGARHLERYGKPVPTPFALYITVEVLAALAYAHERTDEEGRPLGIVHRDVSPTNVMVSFEGEVKLLDFGIGKSLDRVSQTREGAIKGNVGFMAPEQARGQEVTHLADLFSVGLVLFDLLAGEPFYQGRGAGEILFQAATGPTSEHLARIARLPPPVPDLLRTVLSIDPGARFPSARAFALAFGAPPTIAKTQLSVLMNALFRNKT